MSGKLIVGNNNQVPKEVENLVVLGKSDTTFTTDDEGKIFLGENVVVSEDGVVEGPVSPSYTTESNGFATTAAYSNYFIDCTSGAFAGAITNDLNEYTFTKVDASVNACTLTPDSGLINGAANYVLSSQRQTITVKWDGTNWYFPPAGAGSGDLLAANNLSDVGNTTTARTNLGAASQTDLDTLEDTVDTLSDSVTELEESVDELTSSLSDYASLSLAEQNNFLIRRLITHIAMQGFPITDPLLIQQLL